MLQKYSIQDFIHKTNESITIDVRSPIEYEYAHLPNAINVPLFSNEERADVGTIYKTKGRQEAIKKGLDYFGPKMKTIIESVEQQKKENTINIYCARGGMRSAAMAWLLNLYGFDINLCVGGYKAYRNWVLQQFEISYDLQLIGGYTGSGKTKILHNKTNYVDIEAIANHKGSAFGGISMPAQPSQEQFENLLVKALYEAKQKEEPIWLEDESQRLGKSFIPHSFWQQMRNAKVELVDVSFEQRLENIINEYGVLPKENLEIAIKSITKRLGGLETKHALQYLEENNIKECFAILLKYYDKQYDKGMALRQAQ